MHTSFILRIYMYRTIKRIEKIVSKSENLSISGDDLVKMCHTYKQLKAVHALESGGYISCFYPDGAFYPAVLHYNEKGFLYLLERGELWANRIISFILGALTSALVPLLISHVS